MLARHLAVLTLHQPLPREVAAAEALEHDALQVLSLPRRQQVGRVRPEYRGKRDPAHGAAAGPPPHTSSPVEHGRSRSWLDWPGRGREPGDVAPLPGPHADAARHVRVEQHMRSSAIQLRLDRPQG